MKVEFFKEKTVAELVASTQYVPALSTDEETMLNELADDVQCSSVLSKPTWDYAVVNGKQYYRSQIMENKNDGY